YDIKPRTLVPLSVTWSMAIHKTHHGLRATSLFHTHIVYCPVHDPQQDMLFRGFRGFDHGVGHPLLLLCGAKVSNYLKNKEFNDLGHYSEWTKVADAVIKALFFACGIKFG